MKRVSFSPPPDIRPGVRLALDAMRALTACMVTASAGIIVYRLLAWAAERSLQP